MRTYVKRILTAAAAAVLTAGQVCPALAYGPGTITTGEVPAWTRIIMRTPITAEARGGRGERQGDIGRHDLRLSGLEH